MPPIVQTKAAIEDGHRYFLFGSDVFEITMIEDDLVTYRAQNHEGTFTASKGHFALFCTAIPETEALFRML